MSDDENEMDRQFRERRDDPEFMARLDERIRQDQAILNRLKGQDDNLVSFVADEPIDLWPTKPVPVRGGTFHKWPMLDEHFFTEWRGNTGPPNATQYRVCIHPKCGEVQTRPTPRG